MLVGLVDFGNGCAQPGYPGVYTRIGDPEVAGFLASGVGHKARLAAKQSRKKRRRRRHRAPGADGSRLREAASSLTGPGSERLTAVIERAQAVAALSEDEFDVVVIGGGITGAGVALDAASRGYSVALLERADFASGTSSRSSKLVHGGLRYLQNFDLGLVREALLERQLMVALAPHLVRPLPLVVPAFDGRPPRSPDGGRPEPLRRDVRRPRSPARAAAGARRRRAHEAPAAGAEPATRATRSESWSPERHRMISGEEVVELLPALAGARADERLPVLRLPDRRRAPRADRARRGRALRRGLRQPRARSPALLERDGRTRGVRARDVESGAELEVRAANVVNATGVWADRLRPDELHDEAELPRIRPSRGTHIILARADLPLVGGAIVPAGGGRTIFALPWLGRTLVGTTDNDYEGELDHVGPRARTSTTCSTRSTTSSAPRCAPTTSTGAYAGVRPLISTGDPKKSVDISRKAELYETSSGMITITGGKLTTWRRMAKMAVDRLVERDARDAPCRTHEIPLGQAIAAAELPRVEGVPDGVLRGARRALRRTAADVLALAADAPASWRSRSSPACPTCWPRSCSRPATSRPAASATCSCGARASGLLAAARAATVAARRRRARARARLGSRAHCVGDRAFRTGGSGRGHPGRVSAPETVTASHRLARAAVGG